MAPTSLVLYDKQSSLSDRESISSTSNTGSGYRSMEEYEQLQRKLEKIRKEKEQLIQNNLAKQMPVKVDLGVATDVRKKVKYTLFHSIKFLKSEDEFEDLSNENTFGRRVLEQFALEEDEIRAYWNAYKKIAKTALNSRRADVQSSIQNQVLLMFQNSEIDLEETTSVQLEKNLKKNRDTMVNKGKKKQYVINYFVCSNVA